MHRLNISYKQFYVTLNEIWLIESDPNAPSTWSERGGKQWQRSIRGRRNWDVELGPCAVIRHLCSVAFVWETKRPQADNSRSLIDRQVSCYKKKITDVCFWGSNWQWTSIGSDNGLAPNRQQAIIWTSAYPVHWRIWRIYAALGGDELTKN